MEVLEKESLGEDARTITLGERMKSMESTCKVQPFQSFIVRADGNRFSKFTQGLLKPFDRTFERAMVRTSNALIDRFLPTTVFVCSDEISLLFAPACTEEEYRVAVEGGELNPPSHIFLGRHNKIETLVSSKASVLFNKFIVEEVKLKLLESPDAYKSDFIKKVEERDAIFDARLIAIPLGSESEIISNLIWRSCFDCYRNCVSSYARHVVGSSRDIENKNGDQLIGLMKEKHGFDFESDVPASEKYGVFCKKIRRAFTNADGKEYTRSKPFNFTTRLASAGLDHGEALKLMMTKHFVDGLIAHQEYVL